MTIDERLEALSHTVELLAAMQLETEKKLQATNTTLNELAIAQARTEKGLNRLRRYATLIVHDHEVRLAALEDAEDEE